MRLAPVAGLGLAALVMALAACDSGSNGLQTAPIASTLAQEPRGDQSASAVPRRLPGTSQLTAQLLHSFRHNGDGFFPAATLLNVDGTLYGTTTYGGAYGVGAVFTITRPRQEKVIYSFNGMSDGAYPSGPLVNVNGTLYGETSEGGAYGFGTIFTIAPSGSESVLYSFTGGSNGFGPLNGLTDVNGTLYGTTSSGGIENMGTIFGVTGSGQFTLLHTFTGGGSDGNSPTGILLNVNGTLYGTTYWGGGSGCGTSGTGPGCGTVYSVATSGLETVLHSFSGQPDGRNPDGGLISANGLMYGTTVEGGSGCCGTVFSMDTAGQESVLYSFGLSPDGQGPVGNLVYVNGTLYGVTSTGGAYQCAPISGCGTVFATSTSGSESVIYSFTGRKSPSQPNGGATPRAGLIFANGALYGTTYYGGSYPGCGPIKLYFSLGCGTVFRIAP